MEVVNDSNVTDQYMVDVEFGASTVATRHPDPVMQGRSFVEKTQDAIEGLRTATAAVSSKAIGARAAIFAACVASMLFCTMYLAWSGLAWHASKNSQGPVKKLPANDALIARRASASSGRCCSKASHADGTSSAPGGFQGSHEDTDSSEGDAPLPARHVRRSMPANSLAYHFEPILSFVGNSDSSSSSDNDHSNAASAAGEATKSPSSGKAQAAKSPSSGKAKKQVTWAHSQSSQSTDASDTPAQAPAA